MRENELCKNESNDYKKVKQTEVFPLRNIGVYYKRLTFAIKQHGTLRFFEIRRIIRILFYLEGQCPIVS